MEPNLFGDEPQQPVPTASDAPLAARMRPETFDEIVNQFNKTQGRPLSPHLVWRLVATLAK